MRALSAIMRGAVAEWGLGGRARRVREKRLVEKDRSESDERPDDSVASAACGAGGGESRDAWGRVVQTALCCAAPC